MGRIAGLHASLGESNRAVELYSRALVLAQKAGNVLLQAVVRGNLGRVHFGVKNWPAARLEFEQALLLFKECGDQRGQALTLLGLGKLDLATGLEYLRSAAALFHQIGDAAGEKSVLDLLSSEREPESAREKPA